MAIMISQIYKLSSVSLSDKMSVNTLLLLLFSKFDFGLRLRLVGASLKAANLFIC